MANSDLKEKIDQFEGLKTKQEIAKIRRLLNGEGEVEAVEEVPVVE